MNAIRSTDAISIEQKYIQRVLNKEATNIFKAQEKVVSRFQASGAATINAKRRFVVSGSTLDVTHSILQRFIDMKYLRGNRKRVIPVHNKVIYGHFNNIINKLAFGLTDDVKALLSQPINTEL